MPGRDRVIDPLTGDYVSDGRGGYKTTNNLSTAIWHQLQGKKGKWVGDPDKGSLIFTLEREPNSQGAALLAGDFTRAALQIFVDAGQARDLQVVTQRDAQKNRISLASSIVDTSHGEIDITDLIPGGP